MLFLIVGYHVFFHAIVHLSEYFGPEGYTFVLGLEAGIISLPPFELCGYLGLGIFKYGLELFANFLTSRD